jgi:hypothetical protein
MRKQCALRTFDSVRCCLNLLCIIYIISYPRYKRLFMVRHGEVINPVSAPLDKVTSISSRISPINMHVSINT